MKLHTKYQSPEPSIVTHIFKFLFILVCKTSDSHGYNLNRLGKDDYNCNIRDRNKEKLQIERPLC